MKTVIQSKNIKSTSPKETKVPQENWKPFYKYLRKLIKFAIKPVDEITTSLVSGKPTKFTYNQPQKL